jgi:hypothetical protein
VAAGKECDYCGEPVPRGTGLRIWAELVESGAKYEFLFHGGDCMVEFLRRLGSNEQQAG